MKNSTKSDYQYTKYEETCKISQKHHKTFFLLEFIQFICKNIPDVWPFIAVAEDLGVPIVTIASDEKALSFFDEESEHAKAESEQGSFYHGWNHKKSSCIEQLKDEEHAIGYWDEEEVADNPDFDHHLMCHNVSRVTPDGFYIRKEAIDIPSVLEKSTVKASTNFLTLSSLAVLFKLVVEGDDIHFEFLVEMVDFEGGFDHEIAELSPFHGVEESHISIRSHKIGLIH